MQIKQFIEKFFTKFTSDETTTLAASLAFYTALSLAPLLILFVTIAARFSPELQVNFLVQVHALVGPEAAQAIDMVIDSAKERPDLSSAASLFGILTLLLSASLIFGELRSALNRIFCVEPRVQETPSYFLMFWQMFKDRVLHIGFALSFIFLLIVSLVASSLISASVPSEEKLVASVVNIGVSLLAYIFLFTLMFRFLPDRKQPWGKAAEGGALTALLFVFGKELIGLYLGSSAIGSAYGAAGSVIVLLVWVYYSTLITFIGAQVSALLAGVRQKRNIAPY